MQQVLCPSLIGRTEESDGLRVALARATGRQGGLVFVTGEAGIGKSRLIRASADDAAREGMVVLWGRATAGPTPTPFRPLSEAIVSALRDTGPPDAEELTPYLPYLGRLAPEWGMPEPVEQSLVLVSEAIVRLLRVLGSDRGCLLILEDLHWADPETLAVVDYLADNLAAEPVACVATARLDEASPGTALIRAIGRRRAADLVELAPLTIEETEQMAAACLASAEFPPSLLDVLLTSAEGVPFLVEELLAAWVGDGVLVQDGARWVTAGPVHGVIPLSFVDMVRRRMDKLGPDDRRVLQAASVLGRRFDWSLLASTLAVEEQLVVGSLRAAVDAQLVEAFHDDDGGGFRFRHALTRNAVLADLLPPDAEGLARDALDALEGQVSDSSDRQALAAELAERAGQHERAARLLLDVGRRALDEAALETAEAALSQARDLAADHRDLWLEILEVLVDVYSSAGRLPQALEVGTSVLDIVPASTPRAAEMHVRLARAAVAAEHWDAAKTHLDQARSLDEPLIQARADGLAALVAIGYRSPSVAEEFAGSALDAARSIGLPDVECEAWQVLGRCARLSDLDRAKELFDRAVHVATDHELPLQRVRALHERATIDLLESNDTTRLEDARDQAGVAGALSLTAVLDIQIAGAVYARWQPDQLMTVASRAAETARLLDLRLVLRMAMLWQAAAYGQRGDHQMMEMLIVDALHDAEPDAEAMSLGWCRAVHAFLNDDREAALAHLDAAENVLAEQEAPNPWGFRGLWCLMRTIDNADATEARARLQASGATVWWMNRAWLEVADAIVAGRAGDAETAETCFRRGDETLAPSPWFRNLTRHLVAESASSHGWGEPAVWLRSSADFFGRAGHDRLRVASHSLLRRIGEPVPRQGRGDSEVPTELRALGITSREVDVLRLVADRLGNREIANRLYLSPRTVEKHVASLIAKTDVTDRAGLASYASRLPRA